MTARLRKVLAQVGSFVLAGGLLYLALRGVDLDAVARSLRTADYRWLVPLVAVVLVSHGLRAWRWKLLLEALPPEAPGEAARRVSLKEAFYATMIGYMVNYAAPRLGEVARAGNLSVRQRLSFSGVFGTVVVERVLDMAVLAAALASVFVLFFDRLAVLDDLFVAPALAQLGRVPALALAGIALGVAVLVFLVYRHALRDTDAAFYGLWRARLRPMLAAFKDGLLTLLRSRRRLGLALSTVAMWLGYTLMAYLPLVILGMAQEYELSLLDAWGLMVLGALGVVVPSPGGTGSYHYITIQALVYLFAVPEAPAASYAVLTHGAQLILYTGIGLGCLLLQGSSLGSLRRTTRTARQQAGVPGKR